MSVKNTSLSRRAFLLKTGGASIMVAGVCLIPACGEETEVSTENSGLIEKEVGVWVRIQSDCQIIIYTPAAEMGQGSKTSVPLILAEEMDADWSKVRILQSPAEAEIYGMPWAPGGSKHMTTAGSRSVRHYYDLMRETGARIRASLCLNAAEKWQVPADEVTAREGKVLHTRTGREMDYGEIAVFGNFETLPDASTVKLKKPENFKLIGKSIPRRDVPEKTNGAAQFAMDIHLPDMRYGFIQRAPAHGAKPESSNASALLALSDIEATVTLPHGIGVIAKTLESGLKAKSQLKIAWSSTLSASHNSEKDLREYTPDGAELLTSKGDFNQALKDAHTVYDISASNAYACHAQMEPLNAVVRVAKDKQSAEVWVGSQAPDRARNSVAEVLGIPVNKVTMHLLYLGGGFGRRSWADYVVEAAQLAASVPGLPVKLIWTREDDFSFGAFRPMVKNFLKAGVDQQGRIIAWQNTAVGPGGNMSSRGAEMDHYDIAHVQLLRKEFEYGTRTKHFRSVGHGTIKFAAETFIDYIARAQNQNPYHYRQQMMKQNARARRVLERAAQMSNYDPTPKDGMAMGIAFADRDAYTCGVAQISLNRATGKIRVHKYWCACDAGIVVQPDNAKRQFRGSIIMGISLALKERIDIVAGEVQQTNYHQYPILRMSEMPESIEVEFIQSEDNLHGLGETALPATGGAIASAFAALTGKHIFDMPFTPENVLRVL